MHTYNKCVFLFTLLLLFNHIPSTYSQCYESPLFGERQHISCPTINETKFNGLSDNLLDDTSSSNNSMIKLIFNCDEQNTPVLCNKAHIAFTNAATIVENTFDLKVPIVVNASFVNLCETFIKCLPGKGQPLGAASPTRLIPLQDDDGAVRLFPQALVKQKQLSQHPEFGPVDINAGFNSNSTTFWFRGDPEIGATQVDFEIVLTHEFLHGLGFVTGWDDYFNTNASNLTPTPSFIYTDPSEEDGIKKGAINYTGFQEYAIDKFLVSTKDNSPLTRFTNQINAFAPIPTQFANETAFLAAFTNSSAYVDTAIMFNNTITNDTIAVRLPDGENCILETSLIPYTPGSTFSHVDFTAFSNTTDFLMRFKAPRQVTLADLTPTNGGDPNYVNPIGPRTIRIMQLLGYAVKDNAASFKIPDNSNTNNSTTSQNTTNSTNPPKSNLKSDGQTKFNINTNMFTLLSSFFIGVISLL